MMLKRVWATSGALATVLLTIVGLLELVDKIHARTSSIVATSIVAVLVIGLFILPFIYFWARPQTLKQFGLQRYESKSFCLEGIKRVDIGETWRATVTVSRRLVFMDFPGEEDLVDCYSIDPKLDIQEFQYSSPDATEVDRRRASPSRLAISWRPKAAICPYVEYLHEDRWQPPMLYDHPANYTEFHCDRETGIAKIIVTTPKPIEMAVAFKRPHFRSLKSDVAFMRYALDCPKRGCPQPVVTPSRRDLTWQIMNPAVGENYVCVFFYDGGVQLWKDRIQQRSLANILRRLISTRMNSVFQIGGPKRPDGLTEARSWPSRIMWSSQGWRP